MTLTELRYIAAVARERHFGRAAEACFVSQPTLSIGIRKLEDELGAAIFERTSSEVQLTALGERIVAQAQRVLAEAAVIKEIAAQGKDPLKGPVRLGVIYSVGPYLLPHLIPALHRRAPAMPVLIQENYTAKLAELLRQGELDLVIIALPFDEPGIVTRPLYAEPFFVALPQGHPLGKQKAIDADTLERESLLLLGTGHCFRDQVLKICSVLNRPPTAPGSLQQTMEGSSLETIRHMVASGVGITVLPSTAIGWRGGDSELIVIRPFTRPVPERQIALAWRKTFPRLEAAEAIAAAVRQCALPGVTHLELAAAKKSKATSKRVMKKA